MKKKTLVLLLALVALSATNAHPESWMMRIWKYFTSCVAQKKKTVTLRRARRPVRRKQQYMIIQDEDGTMKRVAIRHRRRGRAEEVEFDQSSNNTSDRHEILARRAAIRKQIKKDRKLALSLRGRP